MADSAGGLLPFGATGVTEDRVGPARSAYLLLAVFCSGAAVMIVEMTAVRVLQPRFGSTTYVWTNVIAVVLAALSVGYAVGGRIADRRPSPIPFFGIMSTGGVLVAASAWAATAVSRWFLPLDVDLEGLPSVLIEGSLGATLVLFAPATLLLGMLSPYAIRLLSDEGVGRAAGRVFAVSTVGSIVGTYLPALWLVPAFGSRGTVLFAAGLLLVAGVTGLLVFGLGRRPVSAPALLLAAATLAPGAAFAGLTDTDPSRGAPALPQDGRATVLDEVESPYQYLTVRRDKFDDVSYLMLTINEGVFTYHSFTVEGQVLTHSRYYDDYSTLPMLLDLEPGAPLRGCIVGLAGGVTANQWRHFWGDVYDLHVDGAELDPAVVELGREHFHLPQEDEPWLDVYVADGRHLLELAPEGTAYEMIVVDAFAQELYIPFHLGTVEFFRVCRERLAPGGVLAMNVYAQHVNSPNLIALENTLATAFGHCVRVKQTWGGNFVILARNGDEPPEMERLNGPRIRRRFGAREDVAEWDDLLRLAEYMPAHATVVRPDSEQRVLTDDDSPLEFLTDQFLDRTEAELLRR